jgi:uncharacterized membrane protein
MAYLLDANVFIAASRLHYGLDFCPAFWDWLIEQHAAKRVFSIDKVADEIAAGADALADWAAARDDMFFLAPDQDVLRVFGVVTDWAMGQGYDPAAVNIFVSSADYYLVAHALARGDAVVTHETPGSSRKRIKIPSACIALGVQVMSPFDMLRRERARFLLGPTP